MATPSRNCVELSQPCVTTCCSSKGMITNPPPNTSNPVLKNSANSWPSRPCVVHHCCGEGDRCQQCDIDCRGWFRGECWRCDQPAAETGQQQQHSRGQGQWREAAEQSSQHDQPSCETLPACSAAADQLPGEGPDDGRDHRLQRLQCCCETRDRLSVLPELTESQHDQEPRQQKTQTTDQASDPAPLLPAQVDRHLAGGWPGQCFTESQAFIESIAINPASVVDDLVSKHGDVRLGPRKPRSPIRR